MDHSFLVAVVDRTTDLEEHAQHQLLVDQLVPVSVSQSWLHKKGKKKTVCWKEKNRTSSQILSVRSYEHQHQLSIDLFFKLDC